MSGRRPDRLRRPIQTPAADVNKREVKAGRPGSISAIDTLALGNALSEIGGGRVRADDKVDHAVGFECVVGLGHTVREGETIGFLYCRDGADEALEKISRAYAISDAAIQIPPLVHAIIPE
jgi:thymidine phosphorylase